MAAISKLIRTLRKYANSRKLFSNWPSTIINYVLIRLIISKFSPNVMMRSCIKVKCRSGGKTCINPLLYSNIMWYFTFGFLKAVKCSPKGDALIINGLTVKLQFHDDYVDLGSAKFKDLHLKNGYSPVIETFVNQEYRFVDVNDRVVIDVGAFVGDSAIYFALKGAKKVYAIEPHPGAYAEMLENIKLNNMEDRIVPINAAIGSKPGVTKVINIGIKDTMGTYHHNLNNSEGGANAEVVLVITLKQLINDYSIKPDILKMDCEGCEFDIILNDYDYVKLFKELIFEIHRNMGSSKELLNKLSNDYKCESYGEEMSNYGIVHCVRLW